MRGDIINKAELKSRSGLERLRLLYIDVGNGGMDFHSIALETLERNNWVPTVVISQEEFQGTCMQRRWVADLHSFSPVNKQAILQVAEGDRPQGAFSISYVYSWRRWNLSDNQEMAILKVCSSPFDPL